MKSNLKRFLSRGASVLTMIMGLALFGPTPSYAKDTTSSCGTSSTYYASVSSPGVSSTYASYIARARRSVDLVIYELTDPLVIHALIASASKGVSVRVLLDRAYSGYSTNHSAYNALSHSKVLVHYAPASTIVHQKTLVIDQSCALISTGNLTPNYYSSSLDFFVADASHSDIAYISSVFNQDFSSSTISSVSQAPPLLYSPGAESALVSLITHAHHQILLSAQEMADPYIIAPLAAAARRGVSVEIVMTQDSAYTATLRTLARAGARIRLYPYSSSGLYIHAKAIVVDYGLPDAALYLGSQNFSISSLMYNRELGLILKAAAAPQAIRLVDSTLARDFANAPIVVSP